MNDAISEEDDIYEPSMLDDIEDIELYRPGGFHPVHIGDTFDNNRYLVIHKLGYGGFSTVWLCRDCHSNQYVAIKILTADESSRSSNLELDTLLHLEHAPKALSTHSGKQYVSSLLRNFTHASMNGSHTCLVFQAAGPSISMLVRGRSSRHGWIRGDIARALAYQVTEGLAYIHLSGVGHGDLTTSNILVNIKRFHSLTQDELYTVFGKPLKSKVEFISNHTQSLYSTSAPLYLVEPIDFSRVDPKHFSTEIQIVDFGQSFYLNKPPLDGLGTPMAYCAPELIFDHTASVYSDVWALGCSVFEIRTGAPLFDAFFGSKKEIVSQMLNVIGKLPEPWWSAWKGDNENASEGGIYTLRDVITRAVGGSTDAGGGHPHTDNSNTIWSENPAISSDEVDIMKRFIEKLLIYKPEARMSAEEASKQPWISRTVLNYNVLQLLKVLDNDTRD
ncbi:kinase-like domain-containing protein [Gymnopilus junonius]|uniref:non-specific serine/threonine protein kinase n=1 Tax=Gymnopilus junonius TaxID=109634 RepID=A0A9P5TR80_GYMJU|nr:kinase-like domain-containing protein [Gymnopilus junonius]